MNTIADFMLQLLPMTIPIFVDVYHGLSSSPHSICMQAMLDVFGIVIYGHSNDTRHFCVEYNMP